jgi:hypothetical protein
MSGVALALYALPVTARAGLVASFFLLTAPVAAHAIARSAHTRRVPLAPGTHVESVRSAAERLAAQRRAQPGRERQRPPEQPAAHEEERP